ncbi:MAG TPA: YceI family protein [Gemmatimonadaceae bacterium]
MTAPTTTDTRSTESTTWTIDPAHTAVEFSVRHMMISTVKGRFGDVAGTLAIDPARPDRSSASIDIAAASIDTRTGQRDAHLRSPDFFDVERFPAITFRSRRVEGAWARPGDVFRVVGDLTIRDVTREVTLDATFEGTGRDPWGGERTSFGAETTIDRRDFGLGWNQALEAGGVLVGNDIRIRLEVQAVRQ